MDKQTIIDYVMHTPHNTNPAVLEDMLIQLEEGGSKMNTWDGIFYASGSDSDEYTFTEFEGDVDALEDWIDDPVSVYKKYCIVVEELASYVDGESVFGCYEVTGISTATDGGDPVVVLSFVKPAIGNISSNVNKLDISSLLS